MYKIAICDDELGIRDQIAGIIKQSFLGKLEIFEFSDGDDLLNEIYNENYFDIILLDIMMTNKTGVEVAQLIREKTICKNALIIFLTSFKFDVSQIVSVHPFAYIYKENIGDELCLRVSNAISQLGSVNLISFFTERKEVRIAEKTIKYIESKRGAVVIHLSDQEIRGKHYKLDKLQEELSPQIFIRCHQSFIVNINYVNLITRKEIEMYDGTIIPVSRKYVKNLF